MRYWIRFASGRCTPSRQLARLHLAPDAVVADVGAGPGFLTLPLARAVPRGRVMATDVREDYLAVLAARARAAGITNVETRHVRPDDPGLGEHVVDVALLCQLDHGLLDCRDYFSRLAIALRPSGRIVLVNYLRYRQPDLAAAEDAGLRVIDAWEPSPAFFALVLVPKEEHALSR